jgi:hypothetical protein
MRAWLFVGDREVPISSAVQRGSAELTLRLPADPQRITVKVSFWHDVTKTEETTTMVPFMYSCGATPNGAPMMCSGMYPTAGEEEETTRVTDAVCVAETAWTPSAGSTWKLHFVFKKTRSCSLTALAESGGAPVHDAPWPDEPAIHQATQPEEAGVREPAAPDEAGAPF